MRALSSPFELFKNKLQFEYMYGIVHNVHSYLLTYSHQQQLTSRPVQKLEQRHTILLYQKHQDSLSFPILSSCQLIPPPPVDWPDHSTSPICSAVTRFQLKQTGAPQLGAQLHKDAPNS